MRLKNARLMLAALIAFVCGCANLHATALKESAWESFAAAAGVQSNELYAIALQESGTRFTDGRVRPWPWTLNSAAGSMRFRTKHEAEQAFVALRAAGHTNIDVGMMQINWAVHHARFGHLDWLEPRVNLAVASTILKEARSSHSDRSVGIGRYHSYTPHRAEAYAQRVAVWTHRMAHAR